RPTPWPGLLGAVVVAAAAVVGVAATVLAGGAPAECPDVTLVDVAGVRADVRPVRGTAVGGVDVVTCGPGNSADGTTGAPSSAPTTMAAAAAIAAVSMMASRRTLRRRRPVLSTKTGLSLDEPGNPVSVIPYSSWAVVTLPGDSRQLVSVLP
ncbi:MAG TPA: hypothetical protein VEO01_31690, partial [Pseudonocardiaceae bacterium]|nr:hypothetical protein [Pseudonocardiaceae bacterium]